jgi:hypothetical protein
MPEYVFWIFHETAPSPKEINAQIEEVSILQLGAYSITMYEVEVSRFLLIEYFPRPKTSLKATVSPGYNG